ncbi:hypothetical protein KDI_12760 [Dictyobacter arantiisoli]|uniref:Uncharacterized protein n=1 Tax=Dictyobacter arantiisoli TaxID=2014874 RepID=A0A5A5T8H8_9CHLR|nr:hypothetical protein KDI_12760 [Dictyobacter arantiisoli]
MKRNGSNICFSPNAKGDGNKSGVDRKDTGFIKGVALCVSFNGIIIVKQS